MDKNPNNEYFITYSNHFYFNGHRLAFRKKLLFDISNFPKLIQFNEKLNYWIVGRKQLTIKKAEELNANLEFKVDVSDLQWYQQIELDHCFNL
jgi:hypothetical protein